MVDHRRGMAEAARARGEPVAGIGPALGFRELKWLKPVYVGDTIDYQSEVIETRLSNSRPGSGLMTILLDRRQPERRAGDLVREHHLRRAPSGDAMTASTAAACRHAPQKRGTARARRRLRRACAARRLYRPDLCHAADLAERIRPRLCRARADEDGVLRHARRLPDSVRLSGRALRRADRARARHRARRSRLLPRRLEQRRRPAGGGAVRGRARRQHAASAGVVADRAGFLRRALAATRSAPTISPATSAR